jgi:hypothetical protein
MDALSSPSYNFAPDCAMRKVPDHLEVSEVSDINHAFVYADDVNLLEKN